MRFSLSAMESGTVHLCFNPTSTKKRACHPPSGGVTSSRRLNRANHIRQKLIAVHRSTITPFETPVHNSPPHPMITNTIRASRWRHILRHSLRSVADGLG